MDDDGDYGTVNVCWEQREEALNLGFNVLLNTEECVDVTLACQGEYVKAHKNILSICSPYFRTLFNANPCTHPIVIMQDAQLSHLKALLQFMYCGVTKVPQEELASFLKIAETLQIKGLAYNNKIDSERLFINQENYNAATADIPVENATEELTENEPTKTNCEPIDVLIKVEPSEEITISELEIPPPSPIPTISDYVSLAPSLNTAPVSPPTSLSNNGSSRASSPGAEVVQTPKIDQQVENILKSWGFESMISKFEDEEISIKSFHLLTDIDIKNLFPKVGQRRMFQNLHQKYLQETTNSTTTQQEDFELSDSEPSRKRPHSADPANSPHTLADTSKRRVTRQQTGASQQSIRSSADCSPQCQDSELGLWQQHQPELNFRLDKFVTEKLTNWGFENLIPTFAAYNITFQRFLKLSDYIIHKLIMKPGQRIGFMVIYREFMKTNYPKEFEKIFSNSELVFHFPEGPMKLTLHSQKNKSETNIVRKEETLVSQQLQGKKPTKIRKMNESSEEDSSFSEDSSETETSLDIDDDIEVVYSVKNLQETGTRRSLRKH